MTHMTPALVDAMFQLFGIPAEEVRPDADLEGDLQLDSLSIVELQVVLEEVLEIKVDVTDPSEIRTVADLQELLTRAVEQGEPAVPTLNLSEDA